MNYKMHVSSKLNAVLAMSVLLTACSTAPKAIVQTTTSDSVIIHSGQEYEAKELARKECEKWNKRNVALRQEIKRDETWYVYDCI
ncbi:MAG: hypothetical protein ACKOWD_16150 [Rhodoferax sp.]